MTLNSISHHGPKLAAHDKYSIINCHTCGFIHVHPYPEKEELTRLYQKEFYQQDIPDYLSKMEREKDYWHTVYKNRYQKFENILGSPRVLEDQLSLLDIGSSGGYFQRTGNKRGWQTLGVEPSLPAVEYARQHGCQVFHGFFDQFFHQNRQTFDVIHLSYVLEHLPNPQQLCQQTFQLLKPEGILCIESPNDFNQLQTIAQNKTDKKQWWISIPHHLNYFSFSSLKSLLRKGGFKVAAQQSTFPMEFFLLWNENYIDHPEIGAKCHQKRMAFEQELYQNYPELLTDLYNVLAKHQCGRSALVYGVKPGKL